MMKTIVVAEDFNTSRRVIVNSLTRKGYRLLEGEDGREALGHFDGKPIDLLITDFNMPNMNGAELVTEIRKIDRYKYIPVLVLSTEVKKEKKDQASEAQITAWVQKPFDLERFLKLVDKSMR
jgi:two-component system chemotaxis response regulator CheY